MNDYALVYIFSSALASLYEFIYHWFIVGFYVWKHWTLNAVERSERIFSFRINLRYFGEPLFQDRTIVGYVLGFVFRTSWLIIGGFFYLFFWPLAFLGYVAWCAMPLYALFKIIVG